MKYDFLDRLGIKKVNSGASFGQWIKHPQGEILQSINPSTEEVIAEVKMAGSYDYKIIMEHAQKAFLKWRMEPMPVRGLVLRDICNEIKLYQKDLGKLISLETGKILKEGIGEVQEIIDLEQYASGIARGDIGSLRPSERKSHLLYTLRKPLGVIGLITAFNFPMAVWGWNLNDFLITGNVAIWKPSLKSPLSAIALQTICTRVLKKHGFEGIINLVIGKDAVIGEAMLNDSRIPFISFTGSTEVGRHVYETVARRLGKPPILELGGNNPVIVLDDANIELALENVFFGLVGTTGQRCTSTRRLFLHKKIAPQFISRLLDLCKDVHFGNPFNPKTIAGPLIDEKAVKNYLAAIQRAEEERGEILLRGKRLDRPGYFVTPTIVYVKGKKHIPIMHEETFGPILYIMEIDNIEEGLLFANEVLNQLSSGLFTENMQAMYYFIQNSLAGICNINCGTGGAESTNEFGGNFHTGWGREGGGDAWKNFMLSSAGVINFAGKTILAQDIDFFKNIKKEN